MRKQECATFCNSHILEHAVENESFPLQENFVIRLSLKCILCMNLHDNNMTINVNEVL